LAETAVSDRGLEPLYVLAQAKYINHKGTRVTADGAKKLWSALPDCETERGEGSRVNIENGIYKRAIAPGATVEIVLP
jgi:hypothetical protein